MKNVRKILLPTDFSPCCETAREHAAVIAARTRAELHLLHIQVLHADQFGWPTSPMLGDYEAEIAAAARKHMKTFASELQDPVIQAHEQDRSAGPAILDYAAAHDIDLIVMGTSARKGLARWFLGSEANTVVRGAHCPVLVAGRDQHLSEQGYRTILAATDFSDSATLALSQAAELAALNDARLLVAHVVEDYPVPPYYDLDEARERQDAAAAALDSLVAGQPLAVPAETMIAVGRPYQQICRIAAESGAELIVMGVAGLGGFERLMLGSTTDRVLRSAPCPVLAHRGTEVAQL